MKGEGRWQDLTDKVNTMAANLTGQVRNIAEVTTAVARGDLSKKITVDATGEMLELKNTINIMVDQLNSFASEVTRVAREVNIHNSNNKEYILMIIIGRYRRKTGRTSTSHWCWRYMERLDRQREHNGCQSHWSSTCHR